MARFVTGIVVLIAPLQLGAQSPTPQQVRLSDVLPGALRATQIALTPDARRVYYGDSARAIWLYDRVDKRNVQIAPGEVWDLTVSPAGDAVAYTKGSTGSAEQHVWIQPLDPRTGLAAGPERRASPLQGDAPSISADGKWLAFAGDDSTGVGQSVVVVPFAGGRERTIVPSLHTGVTSIRWAPDGRSLFFGVNAPVACNPDWSCLPLKAEFNQTTGSVRRIAVSGGTPAIVAPKVGNGWPGLSADGSLLAFTDTGFPVRVIVTDTTGRRLHSFPLPPRQTVEGWLNASTLVFSDRGDVRRLRAFSLGDGATRLLIDSLEQIAEPVWSPDGQTIDMVRCVAERCELRLARADGSPLKTIPLPDRYGGGNLWSPDQQWVAYLGGPINGDRHVSAVEVSTGRVVQLASIRTPVASLVWLPDSRGVIVSATLGSGATRRLSVQRVELAGATHAMREVALGAPPNAGNAIDGATAAVLRGGEWKRVALDGDSSETLLLPQTASRYSGFVTVSPGHERLAFRRSREPNGDDLNVVEVVNPDGANRVTIDMPVSMLGSPNALKFLPGGGQLIAMGLPSDQERNLGIYLVTVATKSVTKLFTIPPASFTGELALSPDGRTILYVTNETATPRVFTMDLSSLRGGGR